MSRSQYENCTSVSPECPVDKELYGYVPNLAANLLFAIFYCLASIIHIIACIRYRTWYFTAALVLGTMNECIGYIGRIMMHYNVWNDLGFQMQISCLLTGPTYMAAGIYLTLKHIVLNIDERFSRIKATRYTWIFITCDIISLGIQGAGGGVASAASGNSSDPLLKTGTDVMIAGIICQVVILGFFGYFLIEYFIRVFRHRSDLSPSSLATLESSRFRWFMFAVVVGYLGIFIRSVYRIPELTGGWGNSLMRDELSFIILDGVMICISTLVLTIFHPGWFFPVMNSKPEVKKKDGIDRPAELNMDITEEAY